VSARRARRSSSSPRPRRRSRISSHSGELAVSSPSSSTRLALERPRDLPQHEHRDVADTQLEVGEMPLGHVARECEGTARQALSRAERAHALAECREDGLARCVRRGGVLDAKVLMSPMAWRCFLRDVVGDVQYLA
jgi:hypothetical protein